MRIVKLLILEEFHGNANYKDLLRSNYIGLSTVVFSKKIYSKMKFPILKTQEDFGLWLSLLRKGVFLNSINMPLFLA